jgi:hypothetical protein
MYGVKCIVGLVPIGYFALISELMTTFEVVHESNRELPLPAEASLRAPSRRLRLSCVSNAAGMSTFVCRRRVFTHCATSNAAECEAWAEYTLSRRR